MTPSAVPRSTAASAPVLQIVITRTGPPPTSAGDEVRAAGGHRRTRGDVLVADRKRLGQDRVGAVGAAGRAPGPRPRRG